MKMENPTALIGSASRVPNINTLAGVDVQNLTENPSSFQSQSLAIRSLLKRHPISAIQAKVLCEINGLGGRA